MFATKVKLSDWETDFLYSVSFGVRIYQVYTSANTPVTSQRKCVKYHFETG